ncbi:MAG: murein biosynthesis integral membrane protein MurJ [Alphaproteobacteria bacterium]|nr:murein biosynthesis integral membrane protein MurJ [Alphaproteobacteria bacterium]
MTEAAGDGRSMARNFATVGGATLLSRVLGFVRDIALAAVLGTGPVADAFFAAFRLPNLFRRLFAEGAFNSAFVPLFSRALARGGPVEAKYFSARIISWLFWFLVVLTLVAEIFMAQVVAVFVPGFVDDPAKFELTVLLTRICFPYLAAMSLMAAIGGILNGLRRFLAVAMAPVLLNVVLVGLLGVLVVTVEQGGAQTGIILSWGVLAGGVAQLVLVMWAARRAGFLPRIGWPAFGPDVRRFWALAVPAILAGGVTQINIFIGTVIASGADSAISYLYFADRLYQLPLGMIGIAIGVVLLPELSAHLKADRPPEARKAQDQALLFALIFTLPAAIALMVAATPIITVLFQRGAFDATATASTASALVAFSAGLPAFVAIKVFQPGFFAREDTATPTWFAALSVAINISLSLALFPTLSFVGIAIATSIAAWVNAAMLLTTLIRRRQYWIDSDQLLRYAWIGVAAMAMAVALIIPADWFMDQLAGGMGTLVGFATLAGLVTGGGIIYFLALHITGALPLGVLTRFVRRLH